MNAPVGVRAAACHFPKQKRFAKELFDEEGADYNARVAIRIGIEQVPISDPAAGETASNMAVAAAREALQRANVDPLQIDVVVEYSIMPQEYLVPVWNMSNKVQAEVGASKSFVVGFSGGGSSNFMVALSATAAMLSENESMKTALMVAGDAAIPGNRILNPSDPVTVLGDGASAVVLQRDAPRGIVVDSEIWSDGDNHDICYIPGGSLIHPDDISLYRMQLDKVRYDAFPRAQTLRQLADKLLQRSGFKLSDIVCVLSANVSAEDEAELQQAFENKISPVCARNRESHGHLLGTDFPLNYLTCVEAGVANPGEYVLCISHGMAATAAVSLLCC